jgi:hypothetical protein
MLSVLGYLIYKTNTKWKKFFLYSL